MHFDGKLNGMFFEKGVNPFEATPSAFATNPMGMAQILLFIGLTEGYTFPEGAWSGDMKREPGDLGYRVMRSADVMEEQQIKELKNGRAVLMSTPRHQPGTAATRRRVDGVGYESMRSLEQDWPSRGPETAAIGTSSPARCV